MGDEPRDDAPERRTPADVYSPARVGAATAFTLVLVVLLVTMHGLTTQEMAVSLQVSPCTVQDHLKSIFGKVEVRSRRELVAQQFL